MTAAHGRRPGKRPGPKPKLSREAIVDAAIGAGIEQVTMQSVAAALGVSTAALYRYFDGRDELVVAALQHLLTATPLPEATDWREFLRAEADLRWDLLTRYSGLMEANASSLVSVATDRIVRLVEALVEFGFDTRAAVLAVDAVLDMIHDGVEQTAHLYDPDDPTRLAAPMQQHLDGCPPLMRKAIAEIVADPKSHVDRKLALLLDGLAGRLGC